VRDYRRHYGVAGRQRAQAIVTPNGWGYEIVTPAMVRPRISLAIDLGMVQVNRGEGGRIVRFSSGEPFPAQFSQK